MQFVKKFRLNLILTGRPLLYYFPNGCMLCLGLVRFSIGRMSQFFLQLLDDQVSNRVIKRRSSWWVILTNKLPVLIAAQSSPSAPMSKNNSHPGAIQMSPSAVQHAVQPESRTRPEAAVTETEAPGQPLARCSRWNAPHVAKIRKYLLNPVATDPSTVQIATARQTR